MSRDEAESRSGTRIPAPRVHAGWYVFAAVILGLAVFFPIDMILIKLGMSGMWAGMTTIGMTGAAALVLILRAAYIGERPPDGGSKFGALADEAHTRRIDRKARRQAAKIAKAIACGEISREEILSGVAEMSATCDRLREHGERVANSSPFESVPYPERQRAE